MKEQVGEMKVDQMSSELLHFLGQENKHSTLMKEQIGKEQIDERSWHP
jgi:hypothetical protein